MEMMMRWALVGKLLVGIAFIATAIPAIAAPPPALLGKSVIVSWQENRQQKLPGEATIESRSAYAELSVYVSEAGRPFSRVRFSMLNRRGRLQSGKADAVSGENAGRQIAFSGNAMSAGLKRGSAGATLVSVSFDGGFQSCSGQVRAGKSGGAAQTTARSVINGNQVEIYSIEVSNVGCRIQAGNVFGN